MSQVISCALYCKRNNKHAEDNSLADAEGGKCCVHAVHIKTQNCTDNPNTQRGNAACCVTKNRHTSNLAELQLVTQETREALKKNGGHRTHFATMASMNKILAII